MLSKFTGIIGCKYIISYLDRTGKPSNGFVRKPASVPRNWTLVRNVCFWFGLENLGQNTSSQFEQGSKSAAHTAYWKLLRRDKGTSNEKFDSPGCVSMESSVRPTLK